MGELDLSDACPGLRIIELVSELFRQVHHAKLEYLLHLREPFQNQIVAYVVAQLPFLSKPHRVYSDDIRRRHFLQIYVLLILSIQVG